MYVYTVHLCGYNSNAWICVQVFRMHLPQEEIEEMFDRKIVVMLETLKKKQKKKRKFKE